MKKLLKITGTIILIICTTTAILAQSSDYQITKEFENTYKSLEASINNATSLEEADSLNNEVNKLREAYTEHRSLIDHALYPDTFDDTIQDLLAEANETEEVLLIIENQGERLTSLNKQIADYQSEITFLNNETDSLRTLIAKSEESEKNLSRLVEQYRQRVEERDEFVLKMMDSLFVAYRELEMSPGSNKEIASSAIAIQQGDNPLEFIEATIEENIQVLKTGSPELSTEDFLKMYTVQKRFSDTWNKVGGDLSQVYGGDESRQWKNKIDGQLKDWKASTSKNMWDSINNSLEQNNVDIGAFDNNQIF
jgi:chromosome segregation ATPase